MIHKILVIAFVIAMVTQLAACGRKSSPVPPPGNKYPYHYPAN